MISSTGGRASTTSLPTIGTDTLTDHLAQTFSSLETVASKIAPLGVLVLKPNESPFRPAEIVVVVPLSSAISSAPPGPTFTVVDSVPALLAAYLASTPIISTLR